MHTEHAEIRRGKNGKPELWIRDLDGFCEYLAEEWLSGDRHEVECVIAIDLQRKDIRTLPQLAYLYGHLAPLVKDTMENLGWRITSKELALDILKMELGFCKVVENEDEELTYRVPLSLSFQARISRKKISQFVDDVFIWLLENGAQPKRPEEYWKTKKV